MQFTIRLLQILDALFHYWRYCDIVVLLYELERNSELLRRDNFGLQIDIGSYRQVAVQLLIMPGKLTF